MSMALSLSETVEITNHRNGVRARFRYTFDTGRIVNLGPCFLNSSGEVDAKRIELESKAVSVAKRLDSKLPVNLKTGVVANGEASKAEVAKEYLKQAVLEKEPVEAYYKLKAFNDYRTQEGYTIAQIKSILNLGDNEWNKVISRWTYLNSNSAAIESYKSVADNYLGV